MVDPRLTDTKEVAALLAATDAQGRVDPLAYEAQRLILEHQALGSIDADRLVRGLQASPALHSYGLDRVVGAIDSRLQTPAEHRRFAEALDAANLTDTPLERLGEVAAERLGQARGQVADAITRGNNFIGGKMAASYTWASQAASDPNASPLEQAIASSAREAVGKAQQIYGAGEGAVTHGLGMLGETVDLAKLGYRFTTDANFRDTVIGMARMYGAEVANDPSKPLRDVRQAASNALDQWEQGLEQARRAGREQQYLGGTAGAAGLEIAAALIPVSKLGKAGKLAKAIDRITPDSLDELGEAMTEIGRGRARGGAAAEAADQLERGLVRIARDEGQLLTVVKATRDTGNIEGLLRSGELTPKELAEVIKFDKAVFEGKVSFNEALGISTQGVDFAKLSSRQLGDIGEAIQTQELVKQGYTDIVAIKNNSGHGIDLVGRNPAGELEFYEIKTSAKGLAPAQKGDPEQFIAARLERAIAAEKHWAEHNTIPGLKDTAFRLQEEVVDPSTNKLLPLNAKWVQLNLTRSPDSPKLDVDRTVEDWVKPNTQALLNHPGHPDHALFSQALGLVQALPRQSDKVPDDVDERLAASLTIASKQQGLQQISHVVLSKDGSRAFTVDTPDIYCEWKRRADVNVADACQRPLEASTQQLEQVNQQLALQAEKERQEQLNRGLNDPTQGGPAPRGPVLS